MTGVLIVAGITVTAALAFYGGSGTGTASATAGHAPRTVAVTGSLAAADSPLFPGQTGTVNIAVSLTGNGNARVGSVSLDTSQGDNGIGGLPAGCQRSWFAFTGPTQGSGPGQIPNGANVSNGSPLNVTGQLQFVESGTLQDACSDAALTLFLQASPS